MVQNYRDFVHGFPVFMLVGKLSDSHKAIKTKIIMNGGGFGSALSSLSTALVKGSGVRGDNKLLEAKRLGVPIITEKQMWSILREAGRRRALSPDKHIMGVPGVAFVRRRLSSITSPRASSSSSLSKKSSSSSSKKSSSSSGRRSAIASSTVAAAPRKKKVKPMRPYLLAISPAALAASPLSMRNLR